MMEKRKRYRIADAEIEIAFTENYVKKYWTEIVSCFIALLLLWMEKHTCLRLQAEQENPRIQGCGDSISAAGQ